MIGSGFRAVGVFVGLALAAPVPSLASEVLSGAQIEQLVIGKTLVGRRMGMTLRMQVKPDGKIHARMGPMSREGRWSIEGDMFCTDMPQRHANAPRCQVFEFVPPDRLQSSSGLALTIE